MGKRLNKKSLLEEIATERTALVDLLETIPDRVKTRRGINDAGWSIKDVLTHLVAWQQRVLEWYAAGKSGETPAIPDAEHTWRDIQSLNDRIFRSNRRKPLQRVLDEFEAVHKETIQQINAMSDQELTTLEFYSWTGKSWTLSDYLRAQTASHFRWARKKIRKWLKRLESESV